jgi:acetyltransferase
MIQDGTEVMIGMSQDPQFGPTIAFGLGGIFVEILKDISLRVAPLSPADAEQMVKEIKSYPILTGVRTIAEIDINPLMALDKGRGVKALDALVVLKQTETG